MPCMAATSQSFENRVLNYIKALFTCIVASNEEIKRFLNKSNYFDEHGLLVVPQASLRLKSITDMTKCIRTMRVLSVLSRSMNLFPMENYFTAATKRVLSPMQSFTKKDFWMKGKRFCRDISIQ